LVYECRSRDLLNQCKRQGHRPTCCRWCCGLAVTSTACPPHLWLCDCASLGCKTDANITVGLDVSAVGSPSRWDSRIIFAPRDDHLQSPRVSRLPCAYAFERVTSSLSSLLVRGGDYHFVSAPPVSNSRESDCVALSYRIVVVAVVLRLRLDSPSSRSASVSCGSDFNLDTSWSNLFFDP